MQSTANKKRSKLGPLQKYSVKRMSAFFKPGWETYHFQLVAGSYLQYFHKGTTTKPHKQMFLSELVKIETKENYEGKQFCFDLVSSDKRGSKEIWHLAAQNEEERISWMEAIRPGSTKEHNLSPVKKEPPSRPSPPSTHQHRGSLPVGGDPPSNRASNPVSGNSSSHRASLPVSGDSTSLQRPVLPLRGDSPMMGSHGDIPPSYQPQNPHPHFNLQDRSSTTNRDKSPSPSRYSAPPHMFENLQIGHGQSGMGVENGSGNNMVMPSQSQFQNPNFQSGRRVTEGSVKPHAAMQGHSLMGMGTQSGNGNVPNPPPQNLHEGMSTLSPPHSEDHNDTSRGYEAMSIIEESLIQDRRLDLMRSRSMSESLKSNSSTGSRHKILEANTDYEVPNPVLLKAVSPDESSELTHPPLGTSGGVSIGTHPDKPIPKPRTTITNNSIPNPECQTLPTGTKSQSNFQTDIGESVSSQQKEVKVGTEPDTTLEGSHLYHCIERSYTNSFGSSLSSVTKQGENQDSLFPFMERSPEVNGPLTLLSEHDLKEFKEEFKSALLSCSDIDLEDEIGEGAFGVVYKGIVRRSNRCELVAVKTIRNCGSETDLINFLRESALMRDFNHPNVLGLCGVCLDTPKKEPLIVLPYMANGDLRDYLRNKRGDSPSVDVYPEGLSELSLMIFCHQIALGMEYLEGKHFVHRDLAARNCMIDSDMRVKVADFGMARDMHSAEYYKLTHRQKLPLKWMAPESIFDGKFSSKSDVWAFAVTCWEVFSLGRSPYSGLGPYELVPFIEGGNRLSKPALCSEPMFAVLVPCWEKVPSKRPTFANIVSSLNLIAGDSDYVNF